MSNYIKSIEVKGLYGRFNLDQKFYPGVNILYGKNGSGKTTLLHILANALNGDYDRFVYLNFDSIKIELDNKVVISINQERKQTKLGYKKVAIEVRINNNLILNFEKYKIKPEANDQELENIEPLLSTAYFPAFRTMIEAWSYVDYLAEIDYNESQTEIEPLLELFAPRTEEDAKNLVSGMLATIKSKRRAPSSNEKMEFARRLFGDFVPELNYLSIPEIQSRLFEEIMTMVEQGLMVEEIQRKLRPFLSEINSFLEGKEIVFTRQFSPLNLKSTKEPDKNLQALSSGERQLVTMLYAASQMNAHQLLLIDEPELSLHVDWQERLLRQMSEQFTGRQIIVCTHSPLIGVDFEDRMMELILTPIYKDAYDEEKIAA